MTTLKTEVRTVREEGKDHHISVHVTKRETVGQKATKTPLGALTVIVPIAAEMVDRLDAIRDAVDALNDQADREADALERIREAMGV